jgi:hypothetical protein
MPGKPRVMDARNNWLGGLNTAVNPDSVPANQLVAMSPGNARLVDPYGAIAKRSGSRRLHPNAIGIGAPVKGLYQWDAPAGKQVVAISNGRFYHKTSEFGDFTEVVPSQLFSTTGATFFAPFRSTSASAALVLYMASANGNVYSWNGTTLSNLDGVTSIPTATALMPYHTRMFYNDTTLKKHLTWTKVGDATVATTGGATDGGAAIVDLLSGEEIKQFAVIGSSLAIATEDSIVRFTGYSNEDIVIAQDTEGISSTIGTFGPQTFITAEGFGAVLSDRGPYLVTESGVTPVGADVEPNFRQMDRLPAAVNRLSVGHHRGRQELWFQTKYVSTNAMMVWNYRTQKWTRFTYSSPVNPRSLARYEDPNGEEFLIAGCADGFVRHMDTGMKDDVLSDGTGGTNITMTVEVAPTFFASGPGTLKSLDRMMLQATLPSGHALKVQTAFDEASFTDTAITATSTTPQKVRVDLAGQGDRLRMRFTDASDVTPIIHGYQLYAWDMQRRTV